MGYNHMSFNVTKPKEKKKLQEFLDYLLAYNAEVSELYMDIHIYQEDLFTMVDWDQVPYDHEWGGQFKYVDWDQIVVKEVGFPDGHYEYALDEEHEKQLWDDFHKQHPEWVKTEWGTWTNEEENAKFRKRVEKTSTKPTEWDDELEEGGEASQASHD